MVTVPNSCCPRSAAQCLALALVTSPWKLSVGCSLCWHWSPKTHRSLRHCEWQGGYHQLVNCFYLWGMTKCSSGPWMTLWRHPNVWGSTDRLESKAMRNISKKKRLFFLYLKYNQHTERCITTNASLIVINEIPFQILPRPWNRVLPAHPPKPVHPLLIKTNMLIFVVIISLACFIVLTPFCASLNNLASLSRFRTLHEWSPTVRVLLPPFTVPSWVNWNI